MIYFKRFIRILINFFSGLRRNAVWTYCGGRFYNGLPISPLYSSGIRHRSE